MCSVTRDDLTSHGGPNMARVLDLLDRIGTLTDAQIGQLGRAFDAHGRERWRAGADPGWRAAVAAGRARGHGWYLAREAAEDLAEQREMPAPLPYLLGYVAAAVACRDLLTPDQFGALTEPWSAVVGPLDR